jgi:hypothetical protein
MVLAVFDFPAALPLSELPRTILGLLLEIVISASGMRLLA